MHNNCETQGERRELEFSLKPKRGLYGPLYKTSTHCLRFTLRLTFYFECDQKYIYMGVLWSQLLPNNAHRVKCYACDREKNLLLAIDVG